MGKGKMFRATTFPVEREMKMERKRKAMLTTTTYPFEMDMDRKKKRRFEPPSPYSKRKGRGKANTKKGQVLRSLTPAFGKERNRERDREGCYSNMVVEASFPFPFLFEWGVVFRSMLSFPFPFSS